MSENIPYCACGDGITAEDAGYCGTCGSELRAQIAHYRDAAATERTARETAEATVARLREGVERLAARYDLIAADHQHNADLVGEASSAYRIHLNLAGSYRERAVDVRALLEGGACHG